MFMNHETKFRINANHIQDTVTDERSLLTLTTFHIIGTSQYIVRHGQWMQFIRRLKAQDSKFDSEEHEYIRNRTKNQEISPCHIQFPEGPICEADTQG